MPCISKIIFIYMILEVVDHSDTATDLVLLVDHYDLYFIFQ